MTLVRIFYTLIGLCLSTLALATAPPIPVDQAFQLSASAHDNQTALISWKIAPGYLLYQKKIRFAAAYPQTTQLGKPLWPPSHSLGHHGLGRVQVYASTLSIALPIIHLKQKPLNLRVRYQGCAAAGFCYPPQSKVISLNMKGPYNQSVTAINADVAPSLFAIHSPKIPLNRSNTGACQQSCRLKT